MKRNHTAEFNRVGLLLKNSSTGDVRTLLGNVRKVETIHSRGDSHVIVNVSALVSAEDYEQWRDDRTVSEQARDLLS